MCFTGSLSSFSLSLFFFNLSLFFLFLTQSLSLWHWGMKLVVRTFFYIFYINFDSCQARVGDTEQGSSLPTSVSSCITSFLPFICLQDWPHFIAQHKVAKDNAENAFFFFFFVLKVVLNQFLPLALSQLTIGHLPKKVNKPARNLQVPVKVQDLTRHWWEILIAMEGPKLEDTKSSAVIC